MNENTGNQVPGGAAMPQEQTINGLGTPPMPPSQTPLEDDRRRAEEMMRMIAEKSAQAEADAPKKRHVFARIVLTLLLLIVIVASIVMLIWQPWEDMGTNEAKAMGQGVEQTSDPTMDAETPDEDLLAPMESTDEVTVTELEEGIDL